MRPFSNGLLVWVSAVLSVLVAVAGVASKITKISVTQDMLRRSLRATIESQERRISKLERAHMKSDKIKPEKLKPPE